MSFAVRSVSEYDTFLVLDIGAFKTKALVCRIEGGDLKIVGQSSVRESRKNILSGEIADLHGVSKTVMKAISQACEGLDVIPRDVILGINSPHLLYDTISMNYVRESPESHITMGEMDEIIHRVEHKSLERIGSKIHQRLNIINTEMKLVTTAITSIALDGQKVTNPVGFAGQNVKLHIMNVFVPLALYHSLRSIVRSIDRNILSIVPYGVSLPKLAEDKDYALDSNLFIDFGYSKTTVIVENAGETLGINTLAFGYALLEEALGRDHHLEYLEIENILAHQDKYYKKYKDSFDSFFEVLFGGIVVAGRDIAASLFVRNICITGGPSSTFLGERLREYLTEHHIGSNCMVRILPDPTDTPLDMTHAPAYGCVVSLAKIGQEACLLTKDPIAKILRYVVYRYE